MTLRTLFDGRRRPRADRPAGYTHAPRTLPRELGRNPRQALSRTGVPVLPPFPDLGCVYASLAILCRLGLALSVSPPAGTRPLDSPRGVKGRNTWRRMAREMKAHERKRWGGWRGDGDGRTEIAMAPSKANHLTCSLAPPGHIHHTLCDPSRGGKLRYGEDREGRRRTRGTGESPKEVPKVSDGFLLVIWDRLRPSPRAVECVCSCHLGSLSACVLGCP